MKPGIIPTSWVASLQPSLPALAEKWPHETTLKLLESQVSSFEGEWIRQEIEKTIEALRQDLRGI